MTQLPSCIGKTAPQTIGRTDWQAGTLTYTLTGLVILFAWLIGGEFAFSVRDRGLVPVYQLLLQKYGASDTLTSALIGSVPAGIALVLSPIISFKSDRCRSRWGRRIPFLLVSAPAVALALAGMGWSPVIGGFCDRFLGVSSPGLNDSVLVSLGIFWVMYDVAGIVGGPVFNALINDVVPQQFLGRIWGAFRVVSLMAGIIFSHWIYGNADKEYLWIFLGMAALSLAGGVAMCLGVKEGKYPPPPPIESSPGVATFLAAAKGYFQECLGQGYYWWIFSFCILYSLAAGPVNAFSLYYAIQLKMSSQQYGDCLALTFVISLLLSYPLGALADHFHPLRVSLVSLALYGIVTLLGGFFATDIQSFAIALVAHGVAAGAIVTTVASFALRMFPRSNFAQYCSAAGLLGGIVGVFFGPAMGAILDQTHHAYRYTFYMGSCLAFLAVISGLVVHAKFMVLGGPESYVAPERKT